MEKEGKTRENQTLVLCPRQEGQESNDRANSHQSSTIFLSSSLVQTWYLKTFFLILLIYFHLYFINSKSCFEEDLLFLN